MSDKCYDVKRDMAREYDGVSPAILARTGTGGGQPSSRNRTAYGFKPKQGSKAQGLGWEFEVAPTLNCGDSCSAGIVEVTEREQLHEKTS